MTTEQQLANSTPEQSPTSKPQVWIGSLSDYNAGLLYGAWLGAARDPDELRADIAELLNESPTAARDGVPAEEFGIFDHDGFGPADVHQYDPIDQVCALANGVVEYGPAFAAWVSIGDRPREDHTTDRFEEAYLGHFSAVSEYVDQFVEDMGYDGMLDEALPAGIRAYVQVDVEGLARDLKLSGDLITVNDTDGGVWLFEATI